MLNLEQHLPFTQRGRFILTMPSRPFAGYDLSEISDMNCRRFVADLERIQEVLNCSARVVSGEW